MRNWIFLAIIVICALFQATILNLFRVWGVKPDLLLVCLLIGAVFFEFKWALGFAFLAGMLRDLFSLYGGGAHILIFPLWVTLISLLSRKISFEHRLWMVLLSSVLTVADAVIYKFVFLFSANIPFGIFIRTLLLEVLYSGSIVYLVFGPAQRYLKSPAVEGADSDADLEAEEEDLESEDPDFEEGQWL